MKPAKHKPAKRPATHAQWAAQDFEPLSDYRKGHFSPETKAKIDRVTMALGTFAHHAARLCGLTKLELIEAMRALNDGKPVNENGLEPAQEFLDWLVSGRELAKSFLHEIQAAELRVAVALSNIYPEEDTTSPTRRRRAKAA
jgi:hypothetical protein